jgi:transcriptional regulator with XRE-family HTH domain
MAKRRDGLKLNANDSRAVLRRVMEKRKFTVADLSSFLGLKEKKVKRVLRGNRKLKAAELQKLSDAIGVPVAVMLWVTVEPPSRDSKKWPMYTALTELLDTVYPDWKRKA